MYSNIKSKYSSKYTACNYGNRFDLMPWIFNNLAGKRSKYLCMESVNEFERYKWLDSSSDTNIKHYLQYIGNRLEWMYRINHLSCNNKSTAGDRSISNKYNILQWTINNDNSNRCNELCMEPINRIEFNEREHSNGQPNDINHL